MVGYCMLGYWLFFFDDHCSCEMWDVSVFSIHDTSPMLKKEHIRTPGFAKTSKVKSRASQLKHWKLKTQIFLWHMFTNSIFVFSLKISFLRCSMFFPVLVPLNWLHVQWIIHFPDRRFQLGLMPLCGACQEDQAGAKWMCLEMGYTPKPDLPSRWFRLSEWDICDLENLEGSILVFFFFFAGSFRKSSWTHAIW